MRVRTVAFNIVAAIVFFSATGLAATQIFATNDVMSGKPSSSLCPDCHAICGTLGGFVVPGTVSVDDLIPLLNPANNEQRSHD